MTYAEEIQSLGIEQFLERYRDKELLRVLTCGSVDDGKSTLIGRLLHDSEMVYDDQLEAVKKDSARFGTTDEAIDFALLVDGLQAEREQGITIDVAYRYFSTPRRKFIVADTPGHEQYTRNMATGASNSDLAVILIDARYGVLDQTRRHAFIVSLLGIRHLVVAVNKMDLVDYDEEVFERIRKDFAEFTTRLQIHDVHFIPMCATLGENVVERSEAMSWYGGGPLLDYLETVHIASDRNLIDLRFPVQLVLRPDLDFRGYAGTIASGVMRKGEQVVALPSGKTSKVASIIHFDEAVDEAFAPMAVCVTLEDEIDVSRGDLLVHPGNSPRLEHEVEAMVVWMREEKLKIGGRYLMKCGAVTTPTTVSGLRYCMDVNTLRREESSGLGLNEIGRVSLMSARALAVDAYQKNRTTGSFILIDRITNATLAAGMIVDRTSAERSLEQAPSTDAGKNLRDPRASLIAPADRAKKLNQQPFCIWLTGLPRSGKSTLAFRLEALLFERGHHALVLDGEVLRGGISADLGFSARDRAENLRRTAALSRMLLDQGLVTICAFVSPDAVQREEARRVIGEDRFLEVFCDAPLSVCEERDEDGLYAEARAGRIQNVTGIDAPYDRPTKPDVELDTATINVETNLKLLIDELERRGLLSGK